MPYPLTSERGARPAGPSPAAAPRPARSGLGCSVELGLGHVHLAGAADADVRGAGLAQVLEGLQVAEHHPIAAVQQRQELFAGPVHVVLDPPASDLARAVAVLVPELGAEWFLREELRLDQEREVADPAVDADGVVVAQHRDVD